MLEPTIVWISLAVLLGGIVGARLLLAWDHLDELRSLDGLPWFVAIERSGKSLIGAIVGGYIAAKLAKRALGYTRSTGDCYALAVAVGIAIGRVGCFLSELPLGLKERAIGRLSEAKVFTTFACTVAPGVNEDQLGAVADLALATDHCGGVVFHPMFGSPVTDPLERMTSTGVLRRLDEQTEGRLGRADFLPIPCSHPDCATVNYLVRTDGGTWRSVTDLLGRDRIREHLDMVGNRLVPDDETWNAFMGLYSGSMSVAREDILDHLGALTGACRLDMGGFARMLGRSILGRRAGVEDVTARVRRFSVKGFMDHWTLNLKRLRQCCVHIGSLDPEASVVRMPFCARNAIPALRSRIEQGFVPAAALEAWVQRV